MLRALRSRSAGWVAKILLGLLILSFAAWGIEDIFRNFTQDDVAEVGDRKISQQEFSTAYQGALQRLSNQFGRPVTPAQGRLIGLDRQMLGELMAEATLDDTAKAFGIAVSDKAVVDSVREDPMFRGPGGVFDQSRFLQILAANRLTEAAFVAQQRQFLRRREVTESLTGPVTAPRPLLEAAHRYSSEARTISHVTLTPESLGEIALPDEAALKAFFDERKDAFRAPEYRKLSLLALTPEGLADPASVSDEDLRARYEQTKARYATPERRTIDQLRFGSTEDAAQAKASGKSFEELVTEQGQTVDAISLGMLTRNQVIDHVVGDAAFALAEGAVSEPVQGTFGPALVRVRAIEAGSTKPFEEVREELAGEIAAEHAQAETVKRHDAIEEERLGGMTLEEVAAKNGLEVRTVEAVDAEGKGPDGNAVDLPAPAPALLGSAFESDIGVENDAVRTEGNGYVWFDVTDILPARERTFEEARARVEDAWRNEETAKRLQAKADDLVKRLKDGATLADAASADGLTVQTASGIKREQGAGDLGRVVATRVFATPVEGFGSAQGPQENTQIVFQVTASETPPFDPDADAAKQLATRLSEALQNDIATSYVTHRQSELGATVNQAALNAALGDAPVN